MAYNPTNPVTVGAPTKKDHYDRVFDNTVAIYGGAMGLTGQANGRFLLASTATQLKASDNAYVKVFLEVYQ